MEFNNVLDGLQGLSLDPERLLFCPTDTGQSPWEGVDADINGMLGGIPSINGFSNVSKVDLQGSRGFLAKLGIGTKNGRRTVELALEGGAGIGRITKGLLVEVADAVDVIEPVAKFVISLQEVKGVGNVFNVGLEDWCPAEGILYDLIWVQWCVGYLTDEQLVAFMKRCRAALNPDSGIMVIKENLSTSGCDAFDEVDGSVTREAGWRTIRTETQRGLVSRLPKKLLPVQSYALRPKDMIGMGSS
ncbi:alpha-N-methyltransferase NTM1 [Microdochium trichocladiopsis]|uniref:Alpha N-terminal protein methyltransferase 1 n=1 Tax=Microdochium trichocladiopsis TaxID=1682393 RepID=A0A9P9BHL1_9PEZI|nr:alpha-N-methyltransferase NTM1 [Microdochium trichocladiopsis]KAH7010907.1 alpha-N-methyltransferase NTM1 [Microdochium trichocladiopsis]